MRTNKQRRRKKNKHKYYVTNLFSKKGTSNTDNSFLDNKKEKHEKKF